MPYPTFDEAVIYRSPFKMFQVRIAVRLDYPVFTSPFHDDFSGAALDSTKWDLRFPSWGKLTMSGTTALVGSMGLTISPAWFVSKPNLAFPKETDTDWTLETRLRFPNIYGNGVFFRICSLEARDAPFAIKCNLADGLTVEGPDQQTQHWIAGVDYSWNRYKVVYSASAQTYTVTIDANDDGVFELGPFTYSSIDYRADYLVVGNSTARQGQTGDWTEIEVDYVDVTGTSEGYEIPDWAGPMYLYDPIGYDNELWAYLPLWERGNISCHKRNTTDALSLDLVNFSHGFDPNTFDPAYAVYTGFSFANRPIKVESRVSDGFNWTGWRLIFLGSCGERQIELRENGDCVLSLNARDIYRAKLADIHLIRSYAKEDTVVAGLIRNLTVGKIIEDIVQNGAGLPYSALAGTATPYNIPQTFNIVGDTAASAIEKLLNDVVMCWYTRLSDGQIQVRDWFWGTDTPGYFLSTKDVIERVQWSENALDALAELEIAIENSEFQNGGFSTNFPHAPVPFFGRVDYESTVVSQDTSSLRGRPIHFLMWKQRNREVGAVSVTAQCQDWVEHDLELSIRDDRFLGIKESDGPWVVDGWTHDFEGTSSFETQMNLVHEHPDRLIRRMLQGQV